MNSSITLSGPYTAAPFDPPAAARSVVITVTVGPLPDSPAPVRVAVQKKAPGGTWVDCGGLWAAGTGQVFTSTTRHEHAIGLRFRIRAEVVVGPVPVTFATTTG